MIPNETDFNALIPTDDSALIPALESECLALISTVTADLPMVTDADGYTSADGSLARIRSTTKSIMAKLEEKILPRYTVLEQWYALRRRLTEPLTEAETTIKSRMAHFKLEEKRKIQEATDAQQEIVRAASRKAQADLAAANAATDAITRAKARAKAKHSVQAEEVAIAAAAPPAPVRASSSSAVPFEKPEVQDIKKFLQGVIDGTVPEEMVMIHTVNVNAMWKISKAKVREWPGVVVVEGMGIRGR